MAFKRKDIRAILEDDGKSIDEKLEQIVGLHLETVDGINDTLAKLKANADKAEALQTELDGLKQKNEADGFESKYTATLKELNDLKAENAAKETRAAKETAYRDVLRGLGISDKRIETIVKASKETIDALELKDGKLEKESDVTEAVRHDWEDFIPTVSVKGAKVETPPARSSGSMTKADIMAIKDAHERQNAIKEHSELFVKGNE